MRLWIALLGFACATRAHAQAVAREHVAFNEALAKTPRTAEVDREIVRESAEGVRVLRWKEGVCEGFLTLPLIEELRATIRAHLERQFRRPEVRR